MKLTGWSAQMYVSEPKTVEDKQTAGNDDWPP